MDLDNKEKIFSKAAANRRNFLKVVVGTAFAAPVMASFSIDGLWAGAAAAPAFASSYCALTPLEYNGPRAFDAHLSDPNKLTRLNGEIVMKITVPSGENNKTKVYPYLHTTLDTSLTISEEAVFNSGYIAIDSLPVINIVAGKATIQPTAPLSYLCDFTQLLEAMAAGRGSVFVQATIGSQVFSITGPIQSKFGDRIHIEP